MVTMRSIEGAAGLGYHLLARRRLEERWGYDPVYSQLLDSMAALASTAFMSASTGSFLVTGAIQMAVVEGREVVAITIWSGAVTARVLLPQILDVSMVVDGTLLLTELLVLRLLATWGPDEGLWNRNWASRCLRWALSGTAVMAVLTLPAPYPYLAMLARFGWRLYWSTQRERARLLQDLVAFFPDPDEDDEDDPIMALGRELLPLRPEEAVGAAALPVAGEDAAAALEVGEEVRGGRDPLPWLVRAVGGFTGHRNPVRGAGEFLAMLAFLFVWLYRG
jgi:hypothetical protein